MHCQHFPCALRQRRLPLILFRVDIFNDHKNRIKKKKITFHFWFNFVLQKRIWINKQTIDYDLWFKQWEKARTSNESRFSLNSRMDFFGEQILSRMRSVRCSLCLCNYAHIQCTCYSYSRKHSHRTRTALRVCVCVCVATESFRMFGRRSFHIYVFIKCSDNSG